MHSLYFLASILLFNTLSPHLQSVEIDKIKLLPVQHEGRIKPLDSVARNALIQLHGSQRLKYQGKKIAPTEWLLEVLMNSKEADKIPLIRVENRAVLAFLGKQAKKIEYFSMLELHPYLKDILVLSTQAFDLTDNKRNNFQDAIITLANQLIIYLRLANTFWIAKIENSTQEFLDFHKQMKEKSDDLQWYTQRYAYLSSAAFFNILHPSIENKDVWLNMGQGLLQSKHVAHPSISTYLKLISSYQTGDEKKTDLIVTKYLDKIFSLFPNLKGKIILEVFYNDFKPFFVSLIIYIFTFISILVTWIFKLNKLKTFSFISFLLGFFIHTLGLAARMMIGGYAPVTNLYSSAIFVGWGTVLFSLLLYKKFQNSPCSMIGAIIGSLTLIIAQHLASNGDTMEVMKAILNSNFWLSTHVVSITLGYSATFLAGALANFYIIRGVLTQSLDAKSSNELSRIVYVTICFSILLTVSGTVLGGIWADRAWGRFWGWDPKEIGALLVILWNILTLHALIVKCINSRGMMVMAVMGNLMTAFSWFGVNLLGIGLHSYGFTEGTFIYLILFAASQLLISALGMLPKHLWRSHAIITQVPEKLVILTPKP